MRRCIKRKTSILFILVLAVFLAGSLNVSAPRAEEQVPLYLRDRGKGVTTSLFGTYIEKGEWLVYPFYEYEKNSGYEYKGRELGYSDNETDYLGDFELHQVMLFLGYGVTEDVALELEAAFYEDATLKKASNDTTSGMPDSLSESGWGESEAHVRWRMVHETDSSPEVFS
jgi:hypothetical protein